MIDFPLHFPGSNSTLPWARTEMSAAVVLVALTVVMLACCGAAALVMVACCGGRRRDAVAESGDSRWLPGVGVIDYVPTSNRSSTRVSLVLSENSEGQREDPNMVSTILTENGASDSFLSMVLCNGDENLSPPPSSSTLTLPAVFEETETDSSVGLSKKNDTRERTAADSRPSHLDGSFESTKELGLKMGDTCRPAGETEGSQHVQIHLFHSPTADHSCPVYSSTSPSSNSSASVSSCNHLEHSSNTDTSCLGISEGIKRPKEVIFSFTESPQKVPSVSDRSSAKCSKEKFQDGPEGSPNTDELADAPQTGPRNASFKNELPMLLFYGTL